MQERLFEFMLEGKRWYDLRRFGDSYVLDYTPAEPARLLWPINQGLMASKLERPILHSLPRLLKMICSYAKFMLMILYLGLLTNLHVKSLAGS